MITLGIPRKVTMKQKLKSRILHRQQVQILITTILIYLFSFVYIYQSLHTCSDQKESIERMCVKVSEKIVHGKCLLAKLLIF